MAQNVGNACGHEFPFFGYPHITCWRVGYFHTKRTFMGIRGTTKQIRCDGVVWRNGTFLVLDVLLLWCVYVKVTSYSRSVTNFDVRHKKVDRCVVGNRHGRGSGHGWIIGKRNGLDVGNGTIDNKNNMLV